MKAKRHKSGISQRGKEGVERKLTSQQLAGRFDNAKNERFQFFIVKNFRRQAGDLFFKGREFLQIATGLASLFYSLLCLAFG
jgi:hypothetical protein